jgi:hypothetical protein
VVGSAGGGALAARSGPSFEASSTRLGGDGQEAKSRSMRRPSLPSFEILAALVFFPFLDLIKACYSIKNIHYTYQIEVRGTICPRTSGSATSGLCRISVETRLDRPADQGSARDLYTPSGNHPESYCSPKDDTRLHFRH